MSRDYLIKVTADMTRIKGQGCEPWGSQTLPHHGFDDNLAAYDEVQPPLMRATLRACMVPTCNDKMVNAGSTMRKACHPPGTAKAARGERASALEASDSSDIQPLSTLRLDICPAPVVASVIGGTPSAASPRDGATSQST